jgi:hypothetical protein
MFCGLGQEPTLEAPVLPGNIRLICKGLPGTNTAASQENLSITGIKGLTTLGPDVIKIFFGINYTNFWVTSVNMLRI